MAKKVISPEEDGVLQVTVLPPEVEEMIDTEIDNSLVKQNVTETLLLRLETEYGGLKINGPDDKEGYLTVQAARKDCKGVRVLISKICKTGRAKANAEAAKWIKKEKDLSGRVSVIEDRLDADETAYEQERDRRKALEAQKLEQQGIERTTHMVRFGVVLEGGSWVLGNVSYESILVKSADPEIYQTIYNDFEAQFNLNEAEKLEAKRKAEQAELELKQAQENVKRQEKELQEKQEKMEKQLKDLRLQTRSATLESLGMRKQVPRSGFPPAYVYSRITVLVSDIEDKEDQEWEAIIDAAKEELDKIKQEIAELERIREVFSARLPLLKEWSSNGQSVYAKGGIWGTVADLVGISDEQFEELVKENDAYLRERNLQKEKQRQIDLENARIEGVGKSRREMLKAINGDAGISDFELGSVAQKEWEKDLGIAQKLHEKSQQDLADQKEKERQELLGDKQRYEEVVAAIKAISIPPFKSGPYRTKIGIIRYFIDGLK